MIASIKSGPQWRRYCQGGPTQSIAIFAAVLIIGVWFLRPPTVTWAVTIGFAAFCLVAMLIGSFVRQDVFIDVSGGCVSETMGIGSITNCRQRSLDDFDAIVCDAIDLPSGRYRYSGSKFDREFRLSLRLSSQREGEQFVVLSTFLYHSEILDETANLVGLINKPVIGNAYSGEPYL
ncbi:MAG: hypothetical protein P4L46_20695 [Fimbriimonas sp.]|nr:hypothetical protein [Fimbriimonas sp.]